MTAQRQTPSVSACSAIWQFTADALFEIRFWVPDNGAGTLLGVDYEQYSGSTEKVRARIYYKYGNGACNSNPPNCDLADLFTGFAVTTDTMSTPETKTYDI